MNLFLFIFILLLAFLAALAVKGYLYYRGEKRAPIELRPAEVGLKAEEITFPAEDGAPLSGWFIACPGSDKTVLCAHGFSMNKGDALKRTHFLAKKYNLFYFDFRGAGESGGRTKTGISEPADIASAVQWLKTHRPAQSKKIAFYGISQGAGAAVRYAARHPGEEAALILEAVYYSFKDVARRWIWRRAKTPYFPAVYLFFKWKNYQLKQDLDDFSPKNTARQVTAPVLLIHGQLDKISPLTNAQKVYALLKGPKELWAVPNAKHTSCSKYEPEQYQQRIETFLAKYLGR